MLKSILKDIRYLTSGNSFGTINICDINKLFPGTILVNTIGETFTYGGNSEINAENMEYEGYEGEHHIIRDTISGLGHQITIDNLSKNFSIQGSSPPQQCNSDDDDDSVSWSGGTSQESESESLTSDEGPSDLFTTEMSFVKDSNYDNIIKLMRIYDVNGVTQYIFDHCQRPITLEEIKGWSPTPWRKLGNHELDKIHGVYDYAYYKDESNNFFPIINIIRFSGYYNYITKEFISVDFYHNAKIFNNLFIIDSHYNQFISDSKDTNKIHDDNEGKKIYIWNKEKGLKYAIILYKWNRGTQYYYRVKIVDPSKTSPAYGYSIDDIGVVDIEKYWVYWEDIDDGVENIECTRNLYDVYKNNCTKSGKNDLYINDNNNQIKFIIIYTLTYVIDMIHDFGIYSNPSNNIIKIIINKYINFIKFHFSGDIQTLFPKHINYLYDI